jgi:uncharacterized damage-inducible protein DinB
MHPSFQKLFAELEIQRMRTLDSVKHLDNKQLNRPLTEGKWSVAQILSHIVAAERLSLGYVKKKTQGIETAPDTGLWEEIKMIMLVASQRVPGLKFKAPRVVVETTTVHPDLDSITKEWDAVRNEFKLLLDTIPDEYVNRRVYKHARAGYLNLKHALRFFGEHVIHHTPQIKRLVNSR